MITKEKSIHFRFVQGAITLPEVQKELEAFQQLYNAGAYSIFLGQVRRDLIEGKAVKSIDYSSYAEMAEQVMYAIAREADIIYNIEQLSILHSIGQVYCGEFCLLVIVACGHRKQSFPASEYIVERLKKEVPVWGKEIFENSSHQWKVNTF